MAAPSNDLGKWTHLKFAFPPSLIRFGYNTIEELPTIINRILQFNGCHNQQNIPKHGMFVIGHQSLEMTGQYSQILSLFDQSKFSFQKFNCPTGEPTTNTVDEGIRCARSHKIQVVIGIGGGSVIDVAKAIAAIAPNGGFTQDYYEGRFIESPGIPLVAIPTTAGTAAEVTPNAVLTCSEVKLKKSIRSTFLIPQGIILDPGLTLTCSPQVTAYSGIDALVQAIEAYTSRWSHPISDFYALEALKLIVPNLLIAYRDGQQKQARAQLLFLK